MVPLLVRDLRSDIGLRVEDRYAVCYGVIRSAGIICCGTDASCDPRACHQIGRRFDVEREARIVRPLRFYD